MKRVVRATIFLVKLVIILACFSCLVIQGQKCIERHFNKESRMIVTQRASQDATFVAFTLCPKFDLAYKADELRKIGLTRDDYRNGKYLDIDFFDQVAYNLTEILEQITITTIQEKVTINSESIYGVKIITKYYRIFGKCFSVQLNREIIELGVTRIEFLTKMDTFIYMHHPGQFLSIDDNTKVYTESNENHYIDMSFTITENTLEQESRIPCSPSTNFDFDQCLVKKLHEAMKSRFNCTVPFLPKLNGSQTCEDKSKFNETMGFFQKSSSHRQREFCQIPCATLTISLGLLHKNKRIPEDGKSYIKFYFKSFTNIKKVVYDYTFLSMVAEIGGYTGLLLGVSVADLTILIEYLRKYII